MQNNLPNLFYSFIIFNLILKRYNDCIASKICEKDPPIQYDDGCQYRSIGQLELRTPVWKTYHFKVPKSVNLIFCFYTNKSYLGMCVKDCTVKIAENSLLEAVTGLLRPCTP